VIGVLPFYHIYGMLVILNLCLYKGMTIVTMARFDLEQFLKIMQDYKITRANLVPPIILALAKHPIVDQYDLSHLKIIMSGAAPLSAELAQACAERLGCIVLQGYGLTETSPVTHVNPRRPRAHQARLGRRADCQHRVRHRELGDGQTRSAYARRAKSGFADRR
jgi:acyl-CoA synthetase (AMP-forming)/AMP-acid ligase II